MSLESMSEYERRAYQELIKPRASRDSMVPERVRRATRDALKRAGSAVSRVPGAEKVEQLYGAALDGVGSWTTNLGLDSVSVDGAVKRYKKRGHSVSSPDQIRELDLQVCDLNFPSRKRLFEIAGIVEGAAVSLAITGTVVSATVSGGTTAAVAVGAVVTDSFAVLSGLGRIVGEVAVNYGYDPSQPEEQLFALQVISLALAVGATARAQALASLSRLTQQMMRRATWTQLEKNVLVKVIQRAFSSLGLTLTQRKLAQVVPAVGVGVSAGLNLYLVQSVHQAAQDAYRLRFLTEKYGLDYSDAIVRYEAGADDGDVLRIDEILDQVSEAERGEETEDGRGDVDENQERGDAV